MTARVQAQRTAVTNTPPADNSLAVGQFYVEMADPMRVWIGVPVSIDPRGKRLLLDTTIPGGAVVSVTPPTVGAPGMLWWDSTQGQMYVRYDDGNSVQWVAASNLQGLVDLAPAMHNVGRNLLHNPLFNVAQRGAGAWTTHLAYTLDRWILSVVLDTVAAQQFQMGDVGRAAIGDEEALNYLGNIFTGNAGATAFNSIAQRIENVRRLAGKTVTLSFWAVAAAGTPKLGINVLQSFGTGGSPSANVLALPVGATVTLSTTWTRYSTTITIPSIAGETLGTNNDSSTVLQLFYSAGANLSAQAGNIGVQSGQINLWGVQLEVGSTATPLEKPDPQQDLAKCQRFYQVGYVFINTYAGAGSAIVGQSQPFRVQMRSSTPAMVLNWSTNTNCTGNYTNASQYGFLPYLTATAAGQCYLSGTYQASADL